MLLNWLTQGKIFNLQNRNQNFNALKTVFTSGQRKRGCPIGGGG